MASLPIQRIIMPFNTSLFYTLLCHSVPYPSTLYQDLRQLSHDTQVSCLIGTVSFGTLSCPSTHCPWIVYIKMVGDYGTTISKYGELTQQLLTDGSEYRRHVQVPSFKIILPWGLGGLKMVHYTTWNKSKVLLD